MKKEFIKYIDCDGETFLSPTEKYIVNIINQNVESFVNCISINDFCKKNGIVAASLTTLSKKLNFLSAKDMKNKIRIEFIKRENSVSSLHFEDYYNSKNVPKFYKHFLTDFMHKFIFETQKTDWELIHEMINQLNKSKNVYYLSSTEFNESDLETFCLITKKKFISIKSDLRIQIIDTLIDVNDSILVVSKVRDYLKNSEKALIKKFTTKNIPCYLFMPTKDLGVDNSCKIFSFGNIIANSKNDLETLWHYKTFHDLIFSMVIYAALKQHSINTLKI